MAFPQRIFLLASGAAATLALAYSAQAEEMATPAVAMADVTETALAQVQTEVAEPVVEATGVDMATVLVNEPAVAEEEVTLSEAVEAPQQVATQTVETFSTDSAAIALDESFTASSAPLLEDAEMNETVSQGQEVAQVTRPLYRGVAPFYLGVGGNIGLIDSSKSAVGDFGFNVFGKISLGPRFAVRPMFQVSEDDVNLTLPVTYNFNPIELSGFSLYPSVGGGVDFGSDIGLLINAGIDVPLSRDFTFNSQVNWRVTEEDGLGIALGLGYNFPFYFE